MMDKILCAIDGSKAAQRAVDFGVALAKKNKADLRFVTVSTVSQASAADSPFWDTRLFNAGEALIEKELSEAMKHAQTADLQASCVTIRGRDVATAIVGYALQEGFDHIVMGSTGHTAFGRLLTGSVVDDILKTSQHPPVTVV
ncbi:Nucleotide-binding universal stress protein, UspA family [Roseovarius lutimaris]|uniref:Nucleotide-binding universal stress protein, UspA family n=1 Tax=Roseovarius lutimaris TaxID=1005928 RepID=A0A1I5F1W6_9RHOB|nr:universal stress protein [Roseovarius lutimaris]SFO17744.1 Nucleotide-binding universal stress protein, UspA family [Roseovarius lutimaris]